MHLWSYEQQHIPSFYKCTLCKCTGVRLWRYGPFLFCKKHAQSAMFAQHDEGSDWVGKAGPAVPGLQSTTQFHEPSSIPFDALVWWLRLPISKDQESFSARRFIHNLKTRFLGDRKANDGS